MTPHTISALVQNIAVRRAQLGRLDDAFNPAALLLTNEMDLSRVIGWMLDPAGTHGQGDRYLQPFLDLCGIAAPGECRSTKVRLEVPRYAAGRLMGRIDIEVSHPDFLVLVENKPTARFGNKQLERYARTLPRGLGARARVVTLLGAGWDGAVITAIERAGTRVLKLGTHVRDWVAACQADTKTDRVAAFLGDLEVHLDNRYAGKDARNVQKIIDILAATPESVAASIAVMNARDTLTATINDRFIGLVQERAQAAGLGELRPIAGEAALFSPNRNSMLRIDIGDPRFDFALTAEGTYFSSVALGVCLRKERRGMAKVYAEEIARIRGALGIGQSDTGEFWLWWDHVEVLDVSGGRSDDPPSLWAWASDDGDEGLAAAFVRRAAQAKGALTVVGSEPES